MPVEWWGRYTHVVADTYMIDAAAHPAHQDHTYDVPSITLTNQCKHAQSRPT